MSSTSSTSSTVYLVYSRTLVVVILVCCSSIIRRPSFYFYYFYSPSSIIYRLPLPLPHLMPSFLYSRVMPHLKVISQSLHIIIQSGLITLTRVLTDSFVVVLCSRRTCASAFPIISF